MSISAPFSIVIAPAIPITALRTAAAGLVNDGDWVNFTPRPSLGSDLQGDGLAWQTQWFYDPARRIAHLMAKQANVNTDWKHRIYDEITNTWRDGGLNGALVNQQGHIYGNTALDPRTGDLYQRCGYEGFVRRWTAETGLWDFQTSEFASYPISSAPANGIVWHPNLFGPEEDGIIYCSTYYNSGSSFEGRFRGWRKSTNTWDWSQTFPRSSNRYHGAGCYSPGLQKTLLGSSDTLEVGGTRQVPYLISGGTTPTIELATLPPYDIGTGDPDRLPLGPVLAHPRDSSKFLQVQRQVGALGGNGAWVSGDGKNWTEVAGHPWVERAFVACSIPQDSYGNYGVVWFIGAETSILWRPPV